MALTTHWRRNLSRRSFLRLAGAAGGLAALGSRAQSSEVPPVRTGYLPITDATPLLIAHARGDYQAHGLEAVAPALFRSWASLVEAFLARQVNVVHVLMPIALWLRYQQRVPVKVVTWTHTNGSALTVAPDITKVQELSGQTVAIPFWYSIHNVALQHLLRQSNLAVITRRAPREGEVSLVVMPPPEMPVALANRSIAGFIVADPFNAQTEALGVGKVLRYTGDIWRQHACCVTLLHEDDLRAQPDWGQAVVDAQVEAQLWTRHNRAEAAELLTRYLPQPLEVIRRVLLDERDTNRLGNPEWEPNPWIDFQPYPFPSYTERLVEFLKETRVEGERDFLTGLVPAEVHADLVDEGFVLNAITRLGGAEVFGLDGFRRDERIEGL
ncbi:MAG: ABC transporter substrate-binding protein [Truepera sp.]|nr:ABC transporter substrate-binding protein [Truepera sp.]